MFFDHLNRIESNIIINFGSEHRCTKHELFQLEKYTGSTFEGSGCVTHDGLLQMNDSSVTQTAVTNTYLALRLTRSSKQGRGIGAGTKIILMAESKPDIWARVQQKCSYFVEQVNCTHKTIAFSFQWKKSLWSRSQKLSEVGAGANIFICLEPEPETGVGPRNLSSSPTALVWIMSRIVLSVFMTQNRHPTEILCMIRRCQVYLLWLVPGLLAAVVWPETVFVVCKNVCLQWRWPLL